MAGNTNNVWDFRGCHVIGGEDLLRALGLGDFVLDPSPGTRKVYGTDASGVRKWLNWSDVTASTDASLALANITLQTELDKTRLELKRMKKFLLLLCETLNSHGIHFPGDLKREVKKL